MKITKSTLKQLIKEELKSLLTEATRSQIGIELPNGKIGKGAAVLKSGLKKSSATFGSLKELFKLPILNLKEPCVSIVSAEPPKSLNTSSSGLIG